MPLVCCSNPQSTCNLPTCGLACRSTSLRQLHNVRRVFHVVLVRLRGQFVVAGPGETLRQASAQQGALPRPSIAFAGGAMTQEGTRTHGLPAPSLQQVTGALPPHGSHSVESEQLALLRRFLKTDLQFFGRLAPALMLVLPQL